MIIDLLNHFFNLFSQTHRNVSDIFITIFLNCSSPAQDLLQLLLQAPDEFKELRLRSLLGLQRPEEETARAGEFSADGREDTLGWLITVCWFRRNLVATLKEDKIFLNT